MPARRLHDRSDLCVGWQKIVPVGAGLVNMGNTCFLNSVVQVRCPPFVPGGSQASRESPPSPSLVPADPDLAPYILAPASTRAMQALAYTPPLAQALADKAHSRRCGVTGFCPLCAVEALFASMAGRPRGVVRPENLVHKLKHVTKTFRLGRQEDAHEFLRFLIDGMVSASLHRQKHLDRSVKQTTLIHSIFGGHLRSQVRCTVCKHPSNVYDPMMDLSLEIGQATTVQKALRNFTKPEVLSGSNQFQCDKCGKKVDAVKQFTIHEAPRVLTLQLKRFAFMSRHGNKIGKHVAFPPTLDITSFTSAGMAGGQRAGSGTVYKLHAVLVHSGHSLNSGHYYSYVQASNGTWYVMNDSQVKTVSTGQVFAQQAYMLFYVQQQPKQPKRETQSTAPPRVASSSTKASPSMPGNGTRSEVSPRAGLPQVDRHGTESSLGVVAAAPSSSEDSAEESSDGEQAAGLQSNGISGRAGDGEDGGTTASRPFSVVSPVCLGTTPWNVTYYGKSCHQDAGVRCLARLEAQPCHDPALTCR